MSFAKVCATRDKSLRSSSQPQYVRSTRTTLKGLRMLSSPTSSSLTSEGTVLHPPIALPPLFSLPLFHSNGLFDQTPIRCDGAHIGQTFSARGSDFPSRVCVPTCLAIRPVGGRLSSLPPSLLLPPCSPSESSPLPTATSCITAGTAASRAGRLHAAGEGALTPSTMRVGVQRALWASHAVSLSPSPEQ